MRRMPVHLAFCACPDLDVAHRIAEALVSERLAACVNVLPGATSFYRWEGRIVRDSEVLLLIKTEAGRVPALTERVRALHPYELPELVTVQADAGLPAWLDWVVAETREMPAP